MKIGSAAIFQNYELQKSLSTESSIYCAEVSYWLAMNIVATHKSSKFLIHSDPKSDLLALQNKNTSTPHIMRLKDIMDTLSKNDSIIFTRIQSHIDIQRYKRADKAAKEAFLTDITETKVLYTDLKPIS